MAGREGEERKLGGWGRRGQRGKRRRQWGREEDNGGREENNGEQKRTMEEGGEEGHRVEKGGGENKDEIKRPLWHDQLTHLQGLHQRSVCSRPHLPAGRMSRRKRGRRQVRRSRRRIRRRRGKRLEEGNRTGDG